MADGDLDDLRDLAVDPGLCVGCAHLRVLRSPRSVFVRCGRADDDPRFPRYPPLPVLRCPGFAVRGAAPADREESGG
jgi:hypothetical protein